MNKLVYLLLLTVPLVVQCRLLGKCKDDFGCSNCAGYTWCETLQECVRQWEHPCNTSEMDYFLGNNDI